MITDKSPLIIGITGPSGSGKSLVTQALLHRTDFRCVDMDAIAREITEPSGRVLAALAVAFSPDIIRSDGTLDRPKLASLAFSSPESTQKLNAITHPAIWEETKKRIRDWSRDPSIKAILLDAPLLFESGMDRLCDRVIVALAPFDVRLARICLRDSLSEEQVRLRFSRQKTDDFYTDKADLVVNTNVGREELPELLQKLRQQVEGWCRSE